jgi:Methyltransferase domain
MRCLICDAGMAFYFAKDFRGECGLDLVEYDRCGACGFCASRTHMEMDEQRWGEINHAFHSVAHHAEDNPYNRNQRYFNQAQMLYLMRRNNMVGEKNWLDWGSGMGAVSHLLGTLFETRLSTYDKYFTPQHNPIDPTELRERAFSLVVNTAVFEHVRSRATLDEIESYVAETGAFAIHTLVPEQVPQDPQWMYLLPVHCAFHTNRSMQVLMNDWGYTSSVYNEHAKMWVLFRGNHDAREQAARLNALLGWEYLKFKNGFMDYWK